jgi:cyclomaltodextrinase
MNYPFREAIIAYMKGEAATTFRDRIMGILENYPKCTVDVLMNFVSTHDIERAINRFGGQPCDDKSKDWMASNELSPEEYERGKTLLKGAMVLQFFLPGVPSIYYGDEAGLQGWKDPFNRRCYPWGQEDTELIDYTRQLAKIRREHPAFAEGAMEFLVLEDNVVGFARYIPENGSSAVILLNRSGNTAMVSLRDKAFGRYAFSTVISGICDGDAVILPKNSYAVISAVRTNVPNAR